MDYVTTCKDSRESSVKQLTTCHLAYELVIATTSKLSACNISLDRLSATISHQPVQFSSLAVASQKTASQLLDSQNFL